MSVAQRGAPLGYGPYEMRMVRKSEPTTVKVRASASLDATALAYALGRLDVSSFPIPNHLTIEARGEDVKVTWMLFVPDRDTGRDETITGFMVLDARFEDADYSYMAVQSYLVSTLAHELDEHLKLDGRRMRDPHAGEAGA